MWLLGIYNSYDSNTCVVVYSHIISKDICIILVIVDTHTIKFDKNVIRPEGITDIGVNILIKADSDILSEKGDNDNSEIANEVW